MTATRAPPWSGTPLTCSTIKLWPMPTMFHVHPLVSHRLRRGDHAILKGKVDAIRSLKIYNCGTHQTAANPEHQSPIGTNMRIQRSSTLHHGKNSIESIKSKLEEAEDRISEVEDKVGKNTQVEQLLEKKIKNQEESLRELWDNTKQNNIRIIGVPEGEETEQGIENLFEEIMTENFPDIGKKKLTQIKEAHRVPNKMSPKRMTRRHIIIKLANTNDKYGFTSIITAGIEKPQCVVCCEVLSAESMKPNKLKCHFDSKHPSFAGKDTNYFRSKADGLKKARFDTGGKYHKQNVAAVEASYLVALRIARAMKPHTIAEDLLLPAAKDIVRVMIRDEFVMKLSAISLSNDTVRRIDDMSADILDQVIQEIKSAPLPIFSIQLDESTDVANCSQLLVYVRYSNDGDFKDEFLFF
ncbi:hypothetical protein QTO34_000511 [Cnephaeus nilssonii]|uniref:L1 transposable element RRM domain-containing protein n=1 Tax=Cnephaeus nilssonii TaxID=3371016 RepID=A0AA40LUF7_CNENI|nr:hypothetical protein QTO34_000511 [Eptesicus nilssonii]